MVKENLKASFIVIGIIALIFAVITISVLTIHNSKEDKENFPDYTNITVKDSDFEDPSSESYMNIKKRLENDYYFIKETLISNYNYKTYTSADLKDMLWNYIFSYELKNTKYLSNFNMSSGKFCMRSNYVINSFKELYGVNIGLDIDYLQGYIYLVSYTTNRYCFNFEEVSNQYNNRIKILIDGIESKDKVIKANVYVYEFYDSDTEEERTLIYNLEKAIEGTNVSDANYIVEKQLNGKVTHKQFQFKINNNADFFKYQILSSKNLEY